MAPRKSAGKGKKVDNAPPRSRVRGSSSHGDAVRENEPVESRFVSKDAQTLFYQVLQKEVLTPSMRFDWIELDSSEFSDVFSEIVNLGLRDFLGFHDDIYEDIVREFYANLVAIGSNVEDGVTLSTKICGKAMYLCESDLRTMFNLPKGGVRPRASLTDFEILRNAEGDTDEEAEENFGYTEEKGADLLIRLCSDHSPPFEATDLPLNYRLFHYAINRVVFPKKASSNQITALDKEILWHLEEGRTINYPSLILQMMKKKANQLRGMLKGKPVRHKGMPYAALISHISLANGCNLDSYVSFPYPQSWRFTPYNLRSMRLVRTVEKGWVYSFHVEKLGLTLVGEQVLSRKRSKRTAERPSSSRPSNVGRSEVSQADIEELRNQLDEINERHDDQQDTLIRLERKVDENRIFLTRLEKSIKKIFEKIGCRHDDSSS